MIITKESSASLSNDGVRHLVQIGIKDGEYVRSTHSYWASMSVADIKITQRPPTFTLDLIMSS
jgi:hypothetical protein